MRDGTDAVADWPLLNALVNTAAGATWVSVHHGGGVGIGYSQHAGMVVVADGTDLAAQKLERVLTTDPGMGVIRHVDAGYERAIDVARERGVRIPMRDGSGGRRFGPSARRRARAQPSRRAARASAVCHDNAVELVESVPNVSEGRRLEVVDRLAAAVASVPGVHLLDRTSDASHNRSVFTLAGEVRRRRDALERLVAVALDEIDMRTQTGEHPRIGAVDVIPFVPLAETTLEDVRRVCPGLRASHRRAVRPARLPLRGRSHAAGPRPAGGCPARPVRRARRRDRDRRAGARLRPRADASARRGDGGRGPAVPDRLEHQPRVGGPRPREADRAPDPGVVRRPSRRPGEGLLDRGARLRPGLDEPAGLRDHADLARLGGRRAGGRRTTASRSASRS